MAVPKLPPGFELIEEPTNLPEGFELIQPEPDVPAYDSWTQMGKDTLRSAAQGLSANTSDEAIAGIRSLFGTDYETAVKEEREALKRLRRHYPELAYPAEIAGGLVMPGGAIIGGALRAPTLAGRMVRGAAVGSGIGAAAGAGAAEGGIGERAEGALHGMGAGAAIGTALPVAGQVLSPVGRTAYNYMSPTLARWAATRDQLMSKYGVHASGGGGSNLPTGADAAAEQSLANMAVQKGANPDEWERRLAQYDHDRTFGQGSQAPSAISMMEVEPAFAAAAGSAGRANPEAAARNSAFIMGRQTGATPPGRTAAEMEEMGLTTRNLYDPTKGPTVGDEAAGQHERIREAVARAERIYDTEHHGFKGNARLTDADIIEKMNKEAKELYRGPGGLYETYKGYDLTPHIQPVFDKFLAAAPDAPRDIAAALRRAISKFTPESGRMDVEAFDHSKRQLYGVVENIFSKPDAKSATKAMGKALQNLHDELLAAVDSVKHKGLGKRYAGVREAYGTRAQQSELIKLGREAWNGEPNMVADMFKRVNNREGDPVSKLIRHGLLQGYDDMVHSQGVKRGTDIAGRLDTSHFQSLMKSAVPRTATKTGRKKVHKGHPRAYADRPERLGGYMDTERQIVETRNRVLGGSSTQRNIKDDDNFDTANGLAEAFQSLRGGGTSLAIEGFKALATKFFGFRQDTAAQISKKLATANRKEMAALIARLRVRMGKNRFDQLSQLMQAYTGQVQRSGVIAGTAGASE